MTAIGIGPQLDRRKCVRGSGTVAGDPPTPADLASDAQTSSDGGGCAISSVRAPENADVVAEATALAARARRELERLAVRGGEEDRRAAEEEAEGRGDLRDRLWPLGPAAYRHVRRGRAHHHGAPRVPRAHRRQGEDAADRLLRRHGRPAQGAGQRAEQGHAGGASRQAADAGAGPVLERVSVVRRAQQCAAARLPRPVRLRLRVPVVDRLLQVRPLRRDAAAVPAALRRRDEDHAAVAARGARAILFAVPADPSEDRHRDAGAGSSRMPPRAPSRGAIRTRASASRRRSPAGTASCNGSRTGRCAGSRSASTTRWPART